MQKRPDILYTLKENLFFIFDVHSKEFAPADNDYWSGLLLENANN